MYTFQRILNTRMWFSLRLLLVHILRIYFFYLFLSLISFVTVHTCWPSLNPALSCSATVSVDSARYDVPPPPTHNPQHHYNKVWQLSATLYIKLQATSFSLLMLSLNHLSVTPIQCCQVSLLTSTATTVTTNVPNVMPSLFSSSTTRSVEVPSIKECHADPILFSSITSWIQTPSVTPILLSSSSALQIQAPIASCHAVYTVKF